MKPIELDSQPNQNQNQISNRRLSIINQPKSLQIQLQPNPTSTSKTKFNLKQPILTRSPSNPLPFIQSSNSKSKLPEPNHTQSHHSSNQICWICWMTIKRLVYSIYSHLINLTITSINSIWVPKPIRLRSNHSLHSSYLQSHSNSLGLSNQSYLICIGLLILGSIEIIFNSSSLDPHHLPLSNAHQLKLIRNQMKYAPFDYLKQNSLLPESNSNYNVSLNSLQHRWIHPRPFSNSSGRSFVKQDVTAVLLNWNRPENVVLIVAHLCRYDFIHSIIIWNNNHDSNPLKKEDFVHTECASHKLSIINSPSNLYFVSRYLACLQSVTEYCFFQDDDTIVTSIRTMYHQFKSDPKSIVVQSDPIYSVMYGHEWCFKNQAGTLDTCFAWLGHGSFVSKAMVLRFMKTVSSLSLPADQIALSDNFFTTSFNQKPLVMVTSSIFNLPSLAIGFSDGHHGLQRNRIYIQKGVEELSKMVQKNPLEFIPRINSKEASMMKSTNFLDTYMFVCNVEVFPNLTIFWNSQRFGSLELWENRLGKVGRSLSINEAGEVGIEDGVWSEGEEWVIRFPVSAAVDGDLSTCWRSINPISKDEFIGIKLIDKVRVNEKKLKMVLTINRSKEIFQSVLLQGYFNSKWITLSFSKFDCERIEKNQLEPLMNSKGQEKEGEGEDWIERCVCLVEVDGLGLGVGVREGVQGEEEEDGLEGIRLVSLLDHWFGWSVWEIELRIEDEDEDEDEVEDEDEDEVVDGVVE